MSQLILVRHGQSEWNKKNLFTGWVDIPLSSQGIQEAFAAGKTIQYIPIDVIFTSTLVRALMTAMLLMNQHQGGKIPYIVHNTGRLGEWGKIGSNDVKNYLIPVYQSDALNERMYGDLQGLNKHETMQKFGEEQVKIWRRSFRTAPPNGESLEMTAQRAIPFFEQHIMSHLQQNKNVLVVAHGNSLRAIVKLLDHLDEKEVVNLELETGIPLLYEFQNGTFCKKQL